MPVRPQQPQQPSPFLQACRAYLQELQAAGPAFRRRADFFLAYLRGLVEPRRPALPRLPDFAQLGRRFLGASAVLVRSAAQGVTFLARRRPSKRAFSLKAAFRALLRSDFSTTLVRLVAYLGCLTMLAIMAMHMSRAIPSPVRSELEPQPEWVQVAKPFPAFFIAMPEVADSGQDYILQRHKAGGRRDIMTWGALKGATPHLMIEIHRPLSESVSFGSPAREIAARLADVDAGPVRAAGEMETKFGPVALVEFSLSNPARQCLGFARSYEEPQLQILGWHCSSGAAMVEREVTACALDRLSPVSAGSDPKLREFFARAELKRNFCGQRSHILVPTPRLGPAAAPPGDIKRGRLAAG